MSDKSVKDPKVEAFLKQISETRANASTPAVPSEPAQIPPSTTKSEPNKSPVKVGDGGTGGGGGGKGGSSGGWFGGDGFSGFLKQLNTVQRIFLGLFVMLLFAVCAQLINLWFLEKTIAYKKMYDEASVSNSKTPASISADNTSVVKPNHLQKSTVYGISFDCPTISNQEERNAIFDSKEVQIVESGKSFHAPSGCMIIQVNETVTDLKGNDYLLSVADPSASGKFFRCGTYSGLNNTLKECKSFLNYHAGRKVIVGVNGGSLIIN